MRRKIVIYGLRARSGKFVYIGRTLNPWTRRSAHKVQFPSCRFTVIRECRSKTMASRLERQIIRACKSKGQASANRMFPGMATGKPKLDWLTVTIRLPASLAPKITLLTEAEQKRDAMRKGTASGALARFVTEQLEGL